MQFLSKITILWGSEQSRPWDPCESQHIAPCGIKGIADNGPALLQYRTCSQNTMQMCLEDSFPLYTRECGNQHWSSLKCRCWHFVETLLIHQTVCIMELNLSLKNTLSWIWQFTNDTEKWETTAVSAHMQTKTQGVINTGSVDLTLKSVLLQLALAHLLSLFVTFLFSWICLPHSLFICLFSSHSRMYVLTPDQGQRYTKGTHEKNKRALPESHNRNDNVPHSVQLNTKKTKRKAIKGLDRGHGQRVVPESGQQMTFLEKAPYAVLVQGTLLFIEGIYRSDFPEVILRKMPVLITSRVLPVPHFTAGWAQAAGDPACSPGSPIKSSCPREHRHALLVLHWVGLWSSKTRISQGGFTRWVCCCVE